MTSSRKSQQFWRRIVFLLIINAELPIQGEVGGGGNMQITPIWNL